MLLFAATFGADEGGLTAVIKGEKGARTPVTFVMSELLFNDSWSENEKDLLYAMQEDLNYLLDNLK